MESGQNAASATGVAIGFLAASIGVLYTAFAHWGIPHGVEPMELTALRLGGAGILTLPVLVRACWVDLHALVRQWRAWFAIVCLAGAPFGLLMFGALRFAPASHGALFPIAAMSIMGLVVGWLVLGERMGLRKVASIGLVLVGLLFLAGMDPARFSAPTLAGEVMYVAAGTLWAGFHIVLRRRRLDPLLATSVAFASALATYLPLYLALRGTSHLLAVPAAVVWVEVFVQGLIGGGTLMTYAMIVTRFGVASAGIFTSPAPGLATVVAWPLLGFTPIAREGWGIALATSGLVLALTASAASQPRQCVRRLSARGRLVVLGLVGSALTCAASTVTSALLDRQLTVSWPQVLSRFLVSYCAAAAVVFLVFPVLMPRLAAWLKAPGALKRRA